MGLETRSINLIKAIRYKILNRHGGLEAKGNLPKYLKNDANEPEKLVRHMGENPVDLITVFGVDAEMFTNLYEDLLEKQRGSNADDYNDLGSLWKFTVTAYERLFKIAQDHFPSVWNVWSVIEPRFRKIKRIIVRFQADFEKRKKRIRVQRVEAEATRKKDALKRAKEDADRRKKPAARKARPSRIRVDMKKKRLEAKIDCFLADSPLTREGFTKW